MCSAIRGLDHAYPPTTPPRETLDQPAVETAHLHHSHVTIVFHAPLLQPPEEPIDFLPRRTHLSSQHDSSLHVTHANGQMPLVLVDADDQHVGFSCLRNSVLAIPRGYAVQRILQENPLS